MTDRRTGIVKWFDTKSGFGFITELTNEKKDIFVHYSELGETCEGQRYKYLVLGEYVEYELGISNEAKICAKKVSGICGGPLMCDSRRLAQPPKTQPMENETPVQSRREKYVNQNRRNRLPKKFS